MAGYDPKRPRPISTPSGAAPVDALLESEPQPVDVSAPIGEASNQAAVPLPRSEVSIATPPEEGTANRAVLVAAIAAVIAILAVLFIWTRRRR